MKRPAPVFVDQPARWAAAAAKLASSREIAVDLEGNGFFRYPERICLIQLCAGGAVFLLDPLAVTDLRALGRLLADQHVEKLFHSCDWDLRSLDRSYGFHVHGLFDTSVAARFAGVNQAGLGSVLKAFLGVALNKSKSLQRQDWTLRPLNPESVAYAADDVFYLAKLRQVLSAELSRLGRLEWVREECRRLENLRAALPVPPETAFWQLKGSRRLNPAQRARLRELYLYRERLAREVDRPPFKLLADETLLALAVGGLPADLEKARGLSWPVRHGRLGELAALLKSAGRLPGLEAPPHADKFPARMSAEARKRFSRLKDWRLGKGRELSLDPSLLWPMRSLEFIALHPRAEGFEPHADSPGDVRDWQKKVFGSDLSELKRQLAAGEGSHG